MVVTSKQVLVERVKTVWTEKLTAGTESKMTLNITKNNNQNKWQDERLKQTGKKNNKNIQHAKGQKQATRKTTGMTVRRTGTAMKWMTGPQNDEKSMLSAG